VNFHKSCLIGVNVSPKFMEMASTFLNCSVALLPFMYLGLPVGAKARKLAMWEPMFDQMSAKLNSWGNKYISLEGCFVLLKPGFWTCHSRTTVRGQEQTERLVCTWSARPCVLC